MSAAAGPPREPHCHLCGAMLAERWAETWDIEYGAVAEPHSYFLCESCDALSIHPLPEGRLSEIYPSDYYSFVDSGSPLDNEGLVTRVKAKLDQKRFGGIVDNIGSPKIRLLDIGGGSGWIAERIAASTDRESSVTVVDIDEKSIKLARSRGLEAFLGRFEDFEADKPFDLILMLNLIEHVADPLAMLAKARSLLAPGGSLVLQTPNFRSMDARLFRNRSWAGLHSPRHWVVFSTAGLERALEGSGLKAQSIEHTQAGSFWAASVLGLRHRVPPSTRSSRPLVQYRSYLPLAAMGAAFDFATRRFRPTSQVVVTAVRDERESTDG